MEYVSLLVVLDASSTSSAIYEDQLTLSGIKHELLVYNNGCKDQSLIDSLVSKSNFFIDGGAIIEPLGTALNVLLKETTGDYVCVLHDQCYYNQDWLFELVYTYNRIAHAGVLSIIETPQFPDEVPTFDFELCKFHLSINDMEGNIFFSTKLVDTLGGFYSFDGSWAIKEFTSRARLSGLINGYLSNQTNIHISSYSPSYPCSPSQYQFRIQELRKNLNLHIPIYLESTEHEKIIPALREAIQPDLIEWSETLGKILAIKQSLSTENLLELASLCQRTGLKVTIKPLPLASNETMVAKVVIYAFK
jgi:hypothetical protein